MKAMNEVVRYNNDLNTVVFKGFTDTELKLFFAICSKMKDKGSNEVTFSFDQLKDLTDEKKHFTAKEYAELIQGMYHKLIHLSYVYDDGKDIAGEFNLFQGYERSISQEIFTISVSEKYIYLFNQLTSNFTRFELQEFVDLRGKYTKLLYRQLKQWRTAGHYSVLVKDLRELLDVPDTYETKAITNRVLNPAVNKLRKLYSFRNLTYEYSYSGKTAVRVKFDWDPEVIPQRKEASAADWIAVDEDDDVFELRENISDLQKKAAR